MVAAQYVSELFHTMVLQCWAAEANCSMKHTQNGCQTPRIFAELTQHEKAPVGYFA